MLCRQPWDLKVSCAFFGVHGSVGCLRNQQQTIIKIVATLERHNTLGTIVLSNFSFYKHSFFQLHMQLLKRFSFTLRTVLSSLRSSILIWLGSGWPVAEHVILWLEFKFPSRLLAMSNISGARSERGIRLDKRCQEEQMLQILE